MKTHKHDLPKPDKRGRVRPHVGLRPDGKKARIDVGNINHDGRIEMERRLNLIRTLYDRQCQRSLRSRWDRWSLNVAKHIGKGLPVTDDYLGTMFEPVNVAGAVSQLRSYGIPVEVGQTFDEGMRVSHQQIEMIVARAVQDKLAELQSVRGEVVDQAIIADPLTMAETATFHEALQAFTQHLRDTGKKDDRGVPTNTVLTTIDTVKQVKQRMDDFPLRHLNLPKWEEMIAFWRNRPQTKRGTRGSKDWVDDVIKLLFRFVRWLDRTPQFKWKKAAGFDDIDRKAITLPQDESAEIFQTISKPTYSPEQLAFIMQHANDFWKAMIGFCVNCAFGQSEVGQWAANRIVLHTGHPHAQKIGWRQDDGDSWACGPRPKTGAYGEHLLWPEVADAIEPYLADGRPVLACTRTCRPMWMTHSKRPQSQIDNRWNSLIERARETDPELPKLPFGSLRDVLPDILRNRYSDDIASLALQHKTYSSDKLLQCYANFPFAKLFTATDELREHFRPMLDALPMNKAKINSEPLSVE